MDTTIFLNNKRMDTEHISPLKLHMLTTNYIISLNIFNVKTYFTFLYYCSFQGTSTKKKKLGVLL